MSERREFPRRVFELINELQRELEMSIFALAVVKPDGNTSLIAPPSGPQSVLAATLAEQIDEGYFSRLPE